MRFSSSRHDYVVRKAYNPRTRNHIHFTSPNDPDYVNFAELTKLLTVAPFVNSRGIDCTKQPSLSSVKGKERANLTEAAFERPTKRAKLSENRQNTGSDGSVAEHIEVAQHTLDIDFDLTEENGLFEVKTPDLENCDVVEVLRQRRSSHRADETLAFDAGQIQCNRVSFLTFEGSVDGNDYDGEARLFSLPSDKVLSTNDSSFDLRYLDMQNILQAALVLQNAGRARIDCFLHIIARPLCDEDSLPISLRVFVTVSLTVPNIFEPLPQGQRESLEVDSQRRLLLYLFGPSPTPEAYSGSTDMHFFLSSLHAAPNLPNEASSSTIQHSDLQPTLLPFQRRSVAWLLSREHKFFTESGKITSASKHAELPLFWGEVNLPEIGTAYYNRLTGDLLPFFPPLDEFTGAILAEEPGLGKTLESIALVLLNPSSDRDPSEKYWDPEAKVNVGKIKTSLIVTPPSLAQQWADELARHAPTLKIFVYEGYTKPPPSIRRAEAERQKEREREKTAAHELKYRKRRLDQDDVVEETPLDTANQTKTQTKTGEPGDWCSYINTFDVCITTYNTLRTDLAVARPPVTRPRREVGNYLNLERVRSPLIQCEWLRVIMDEVQMAGGDRIEEMVSLIPRVSSLAVSGTPARATVDDLKHVLSFLRVTAATQSPRIWNRLKLPGFAFEFKSLFERIGVRTVKAKVQHELTIPQQKRYIVPIELGRVERHVYDQNLEQALLELGLDARGVSASENWELDVHALRSWVRRLRGICTHPQVGQLMKQNDRLMSKPGAIKTIAEVLENMKNENWSHLMTDRRAKAVNEVQIARLLQHVENDGQRYRTALEILLRARENLNALHGELMAVLNEIRAKRRALKEEVTRKHALQSTNVSVDEDVNMVEPSSSKSKGKQRVTASEDRETENESESLEDELQNNPVDAELKARHGAVSSRIRECTINLHQIHFLLGDVYHTLGPSYSQQEDEAYENAEKIRRSFLQPSEQAAKELSEALKSQAEMSRKHEVRLNIPHCGKGGKRSEDLLLEADTIIDLLNAQAELLLAWRKRIFDLLTQSLTSNDQADGEEYGRSLEVQGEAETYIQACMALFADRREALILERTALAAFDARERKIRHTVAAQRAAAGLEDIDPNLHLELEPEQEVLKLELTTERKLLLKKFNYGGRAIKSIMLDLSNIINEYPDNKNHPERLAAIEWSAHLRRLISEQNQLHDRLEEDMALIRNTFNARVKYFAQLQELSDTVAEVAWEGSVAQAIETAREEDDRLSLEINKTRARQRYLDNLVSDHADASFDEDDDCCILCKCEFVRGFLTQCAHVFCEDCLKAWFSKREGKACPVCRTAIDPDQLRRVTMREKMKEKNPRTTCPLTNEPVPLSKRVIEYNKISPDLIRDVQKVEAHGSYGSKIETIVKHLLYLQENDPGAKSIIFSAWADSLHILQHALTANGISSLRIDQSKSKKSAAKMFRTDPTILVLLLHGERENAGLNITCASRVFLLESVVQHAFEIQAIARIDRMGQTRPTEVFCYYADGTVEKNILDLAARKGMSLYVKGKESGTLKMTTLELDEDTKVDAPAAGKKDKKLLRGDFIYKADDMLAILFPHMYEELEYLLPEDDSDRNAVDAERLPRDDFIDHRAPVPGPSKISLR